MLLLLPELFSEGPALTMLVLNAAPPWTQWPLPRVGPPASNLAWKMGAVECMEAYFLGGKRMGGTTLRAKARRKRERAVLKEMKAVSREIGRKTQ